MARRGDDTLSTLVLVGGLGLLAAYFGLLGNGAKCKVKGWFHVPDPTCGTGTVPAPAPPNGGACCASQLSPAAYIAATGNTNIYQQIREWQQARRQNGENPCDWSAFRAHLRGIGAPDPGPTPFREFCYGS